VQQTSS